MKSIERQIEVSIEDAIKLNMLNQAIVSQYDVSKKRFWNALCWMFDTNNEQKVVSYIKQNLFFDDNSDYYGLPLRIANHLTGDEVDLIQYMNEDINNFFMNKKAFGFKNAKKNRSDVVKLNVFDFDTKTLKFAYRTNILKEDEVVYG